MNTLKEVIKTRSGEQKELKNQRKTVNIVGERQLPAWQAAYKVQTNKEDLRIMYAVYGLLRGKTFHQIENHYPEEGHPLYQYQNKIQELVAKYSEKTIHTDQQRA